MEAGRKRKQTKSFTRILLRDGLQEELARIPHFHAGNPPPRNRRIHPERPKRRASGYLLAVITFPQITVHETHDAAEHGARHAQAAYSFGTSVDRLESETAARPRPTDDHVKPRQYLLATGVTRCHPHHTSGAEGPSTIEHNALTPRGEIDRRPTGARSKTEWASNRHAGDGCELGRFSPSWERKIVRVI